MWLSQDDPLAGAVGSAVRAGDLAALRELLAGNPGLASARIAGRQPGGFRTPLHVAADWPGFFPNGRAVVALLVEFGADPDAGCE
ncbi:MAG: ankyrin repeat domain-containing protein, partial [Chloroflexi bacterium]